MKRLLTILTLISSFSSLGQTTQPGKKETLTIQGGSGGSGSGFRNFYTGYGLSKPNDSTAVLDTTIAAYKTWVQNQGYLLAIPNLHNGSVLFYDEALGRLNEDENGLTYTGNDLKVGHSNFNTPSGILLNDGRATIQGWGGGMRLRLGSSSTPTVPDLSKHFWFDNQGVNYLHIWTASDSVHRAQFNSRILAKSDSGTATNIAWWDGDTLKRGALPTGGGSTAWADITGKPTTITGYGITDALSSANYIVRETPSGTINGSNTVFTLAHTPILGKEMVFINGLLQDVTDDYTISAGTITFTTAPPTGYKIRVTYIY